jgi:hypothetical protein
MRRIPFLLLVAAAFLSGGCEHDGDDSFDLTVYASNDRLHEGECCELVAHLRDDDDDSRWFGNHVTWSLSDPSIGHLSETTGRRVFYYADRAPDATEKDFVQTVYCKYEGPVFNHHTRQKIHHLAARRP